MNILGYDPKSAQSIYEYSNKLIDKTLHDFIDDEYLRVDFKNKGDLGNLVEKYYFKLKANNKNEPDFPEAGLELKTTGLKQLKRGGFTPKERLVLSMIDYNGVVKDQFAESHLLNKIKLMLLLFYIYDKSKTSIDQTFIKNKLWRLSEKDLKIITTDWDTIINEIKAGKAHELSEADTLYLSACTKSSTNLTRTSQPFSDIPAKPRAFSFKQSYLKVIYESDESFREDYQALLSPTDKINLDEFVGSKLNKYIGRTFDSLFEEFGEGLNKKAKNIKAIISYRMMGVKNRKIEEFEKAGIITKTINFEQNYKLEQSISFPYFKYREMTEQNWEDSDFKIIVESRFLFIIYRKTEKGAVFEGFKFWSMPYLDRLEAERVWKDTVDKIKKNKQNYIGISSSAVAHVRPHGRKGDDTNPLPNGTLAGKKCFWFNARYIADQLKG